MKTLSYINFALAAVFVACCFYQAVYAIVRLLGRRRRYTARKLCRYAVLIAARNEEQVIGQLLDSIRQQDYPADLLDVYVVADNCTDRTAEVARQYGAAVFVRENRALVGKGYALSYLLEKLETECADRSYDGYFVFDADNLLHPAYVTEMNKVFSSGKRVVTSYRNSKNFGDNWVSAGHAMWFLRESEYMNSPRDYLGITCTVSGTGFLFADSLLKELGGWNYHLLTEDLEFTAHMITRGEKIAYCRDAILYDEQPRSFRQSLVQRSRWIKGYFQVLGKYGSGLMRAMTVPGGFAGYDMIMNNIPAGILTVLCVLINAVMLVVGVTSARQELGIFFFSVAAAMVNSYGLLYVMGLLVLITERKRIRCTRAKRIRYSFTFPLFIFTYTLAVMISLFSSGEWKPIRHTVAVSIGDMDGKG